MTSVRSAPNPGSHAKPTAIAGVRVLLAAMLAAPGLACSSGAKDRAVADPPPVQSLPAFPGAEGFGSTTPGGRGGRICKVTSLRDGGGGSLRSCLSERNGPRIVVFETGGTIELRSQIIMGGEADSFVTVAGQTAPGDGIQLKNFGISMYDVHDVVIRHIRSRPGESTGDVDAFEMWGETRPTYNIVLDSVSAQHAQDENVSAWGNVHDVTLQYSLIAESALGPEEGGWGFLAGTDQGPPPRRFSIHKNVLANNEQRNPAVKDGADVIDWRSNYIYNWGGNNGILLLEGVNINLVDNRYVAGPDSTEPHKPAFLGPADDRPQIWPAGNWSDAPGCQRGCGDDEWAFGFYKGFFPWTEASERRYRRKQPVEAPPITAIAAGDLAAALFPRVGATRCAIAEPPWFAECRDATDRRIIDSVEKRTGKIGHDGNWPTLREGAALPDADGDGMPDAWEQANGLDPNDPEDGNSDRNGDGYTNVEDYLNAIAAY